MQTPPPYRPAGVPTKLFVRLSPQTLMFARYEQRREPYFECQPYVLRHTASLMVNLREAKESAPLLQTPTSSAQVLVSAPVTPVPLSEFQEEDCEEMYKYCFKTEKEMRVFYDIVPASNAVLLFGLEEIVCRTLEELFGKVHFTSSLTPVLRHFSQKGASATPRRTFVYHHEESVDIALFENSRLLAVNTFPVREAEDVAYYVFNLTGKMGIDNANDAFFVAAEKPFQEQVVSSLKRFSPNVFAVRPSAEFNRHPVTLREHTPYDLVTYLLSIH